MLCEASVVLPASVPVCVCASVRGKKLQMLGLLIRNLYCKLLIRVMVKPRSG